MTNYIFPIKKIFNYYLNNKIQSYLKDEFIDWIGLESEVLEISFIEPRYKNIKL